MRSVKTTDFSKGINNQAPEARLPEGAVRELVNLEPTAAGSLALRPDFDMVFAMNGARCAVADGNSAVVVADRLYRFDAASSMVTDIGAAPAGVATGAALNGDFYLFVGINQLIVRGNAAYPWAVEPPAFNVTLGTGSTPPGIYRVAVTAVDVLGRESGCDPMTVSVVAGQSLGLSWPARAGYTFRVYASATDGNTLYLQTTASDAGSITITTPNDNGARLTTENLKTPVLGDSIAVDGARLLISDGGTLWFTEPFAPHLTNRVSGYVSFPGQINVVAPVDGGVFVVTDAETHYVEGLGTQDVKTRSVQPVGAVYGSGAKLPTGEVVWMTKYGQAVGKPGGAVDMPHTDVYAPDTANRAVAGVVDHDGAKRVVTSFSGPVKPNTLGVNDFFDMEIS